MLQVRAAPGGTDMTSRWQTTIHVLAIAFIAGIGANLFYSSEDSGWVAPFEAYKQLYLWSRLIVLLVAASLATRYHRNLTHLLWRAWPLTLATVIIGLSSFWSLDSQQTFLRFLLLALTMIFVVGIVSQNGLSPVASAFRILGWFTIFANILLLATQPDFAFNPDDYAGTFRSLFIHKNVLGIFSFCIIVVILPSFFERRSTAFQVVDTILVIGMLITILVSNSATSLILSTCAIVYSIFFGAVSRFRLPHWFNLSFFFSISAISLLAIWSMQDILFELIGRDATFTGRTQVWEPVLDAIQSRPYLGYGFGAFWDSDGGSIAWFGDGWFPARAHNGYLENALDAGMPLLLLSLYMTILLLLHALRNALYDFSPHNVFIALVAFTLPIYNLVETVFIQQNSIATFLFMAAFLLSFVHRTRTVVTGKPLPAMSPAAKAQQNAVARNIVE